MKYKEILRRGTYALVQDEADTKYLVVNGYDPDAPEDQQWSATSSSYLYWDDKERKPEYLAHAIDFFRYRTEDDYISRSRMEEISTAALHELKEIDEDSFTDFCDGDLDLTEEERKWFGLNDGEEDEDDE